MERKQERRRERKIGRKRGRGKRKRKKEKRTKGNRGDELETANVAVLSLVLFL